jgi:hypothetical protein
MKKIVTTLLLVCMLSLVFAACVSLEVSGTLQPGSSSPTPCVTATASQGEAVAAASSISTPAGRTSPGSGTAGPQLGASPEKLATREAQLSQQNQPVGLPEGVQAGEPTMPVCPTPTPAK